MTFVQFRLFLCCQAPFGRYASGVPVLIFLWVISYTGRCKVSCTQPKSISKPEASHFLPSHEFCSLKWRWIRSLDSWMLLSRQIMRVQAQWAGKWLCCAVYLKLTRNLYISISHFICQFLGSLKRLLYLSWHDVCDVIDPPCMKTNIAYKLSEGDPQVQDELLICPQAECQSMQCLCLLAKPITMSSRECGICKS